VIFSNFENLYHNSYPNYLAMIAGSDFDVHSPQFLSDRQRNFIDDEQHKTIGDLLDWKNYAEDYPSSQAATKPFLGDAKGRYVRKHVPFLSFRKVQTTSFHNVVGVDTHDLNNAFIKDVAGFIADPQKHRLPEYIFYSPNLDDDGHDPTSNPQQGLKKATDWLRKFLTTWLHFDDQTWLPKDQQLRRTLVIVTFDESGGRHQPERIYTVFLGAMVKAQDVTTPCNHYSVLRTIEDNFGLPPLHGQSGDGAASVITGIWK
jgi:acid phosphatase